jgi:hypothetical protein
MPKKNPLVFLSWKSDFCFTFSNGTVVFFHDYILQAVVPRDKRASVFVKDMQMASESCGYKLFM